MNLRLFRDEHDFDLKVERESGKITITKEGKNQSFEFDQVSENEYLLRCCNRIYRVAAVKTKNKIHVLTENGSFVFEMPAGKDSDSFSSDHGDHGDKSKIAAPMPGKVVKVMVGVGDVVEPKQKLVIVEAMKMENPLVAPFKAEIKAINCDAGELVDSEKILIELAKIE